MDKTYIDEKIYYINDFISNEELEAINSVIKDAKWKDVGNFLLTESNLEIFNILNNRIKEVLSENEYASFPRIIQKYSYDYKGNSMDSGGLSKDWALAPHSDRYELDGESYSETKGMSSKSSYVVNGYILYYNDDYVGGEVVYVNKNISFRPKSKMLLVHCGSEEYKHGVTRVTEGTRYFTSGFTYSSEEYL